MLKKRERNLCILLTSILYIAKHAAGTKKQEPICVTVNGYTFAADGNLL